MDIKELEDAVAKSEGFFARNKKWVLPLLALLVFAAGFGTAIVSRPARVETKTVLKTDIRTVVQYQDRIVEKIVYVQAEKTHEHTTTTDTKKPDGTVVTTTTTDKDTATDTSTKTDTDTTHQQTVTQVVEKTVYKDKLVLQQPNWDVYAGVGLSLPYYLGDGRDVGIPGMKGIVVQAGVDRRIAGPLWTGVFGNTQGVVGVDLRLAW